MLAWPLRDGPRPPSGRTDGVLQRDDSGAIGGFVRRNICYGLMSERLGDSMFDREAIDVAPVRRPAGRGGAKALTSPEEVALRALDIVTASAALIFFLPLMLIIAALIFLQDGEAPLFSQLRIGRGGGRFPCLKFRSMVVDADRRLPEILAHNESARAEWAHDHKIRNDPRITRLGSLLRKSSLDELPQLINVLRGEMSMVGPRPIVDAETSRYGRRFRSYCSVPPGITGLWQVSGRNNTSYRRRVALDHLFARRRSVGIYLRILVMTAPAVLARRGSY